jgi:aspartate kinase
MIVMKFGGTSVEDAKAIDRVAKIVQGRLTQKPIVVVSAMSKVTDGLIAMGRAASRGDLGGSLSVSRGLRERHACVSSELVGGQQLRPLLVEIETAFDRIDELLKGIAAVGELSMRTGDNLYSYGELLSSRIVAAAFQSRGMNSVMFDSRQVMVTDARHGEATPLFEDTNERCVAQLVPLVKRGVVPVMGGFIAATKDGVPATLGRGGSDFSAAIVGAALDAEGIEIWTDVEGMMTSDPRVCADARSIRVISFEEAAELAHFGAKVLHPATLVPAVQKNIPVYVLNSRDLKSKGTCIKSSAPPCKTPFRAIAAKKKITIISVSAPRMLLAHGYLRAVFEVFERYHIPVDLVSTSEVSISLTIESRLVVPGLVNDLRKLAEVSVEDGKAIICLVGRKIQGKPGIAAGVFTAIAAGGINVRMISQGASEINVSFVIDEADADLAVQLLHAHFFPMQQKKKSAGRAKKPRVAPALLSRAAASGYRETRP